MWLSSNGRRESPLCVPSCASISCSSENLRRGAACSHFGRVLFSTNPTACFQPMRQHRSNNACHPRTRRKNSSVALLVPMTTARTMASNPEVVEVFECAGNFSFLREEHRFTFRVHSDSSLHVDVKPLCAASQVDAIAIDQDPGVRGTIEDIDDVEEEEENLRITEVIEEENAVQEGEQPDEPEAEEEETPAKLLAYDGRALVEMPPEGETDDAQPVCYVVHFKIVQWGRGAQGMWSQIVKCIAHLSSEHGMSGRFSEVGEDLNHAQDFVLTPVAHRLEPLHSPLHPLTPGRYELRGITIAENAFVYECAVNIALQENGMMSGTSRELPFTQECPLAGMWTRSGLNYLLQYEMHGNKHTYIYFGTPFRSGLQGTWQNSELRALGNNLDARASQAERGILEFQLVKAVRVWSEAYHKDYPAAFRECVKLLLLASHRDELLPNHLWGSIVSYCGYDWFCSDLQKSVASIEAKESDSEALQVP